MFITQAFPKSTQFFYISIIHKTDRLLMENLTYVV